MIAFFIALVPILIIGVAVMSVVAIGMQGNLRERAPRMAHGLAEAARHMNGDAEPPQALIDLLPEQMVGTAKR